MKKIFKSLFALTFSMILLAMSTTVFAANVGTVDYFQVDNQSVLKDKKVVFFGDSICYASCELDTDHADIRGWAGRIGVHNQMKYYNFGRSGASVSNCRGDNTIINQVNSALLTVPDSDMYILHGGTNDAWDSAPVGSFVKDDFSGKYDKTTFAGGLEDVFYTMKNRYPDAIYGFIINFKFTNTGFGGRLMDMDEYVDVTKAICDKWQIPYLDLYSNKELLARLQMQTNTFVSDGVHPTTLGYDVITPYIEEWLKQLVITPPSEDEVVSSDESSADQAIVSSVESKTETVESKAESSVEENSSASLNNDSEGNILLIVTVVVVAMAAAVITAVVILLILRKKKK